MTWADRTNLQEGRRSLARKIFHGRSGQLYERYQDGMEDQLGALGLEAFAAEGIAVPLDEIARRAGVGPGTVHRHFPTKETLFEEVVREHLEQLTLDVRAALADPDAGPAFFAFLAGMTAEADAKQDLTEAITAAGGPMGAEAEELAAQLRELFGALLARAQQAGAVRDDVDAADVQSIVVAALTAGRRRSTNDRPGRLAEVVFDCLLPRHTNTDRNTA